MPKRIKFICDARSWNQLQNRAAKTFSNEPYPFDYQVTVNATNKATFQRLQIQQTAGRIPAQAMINCEEYER